MQMRLRLALVLMAMALPAAAEPETPSLYERIQTRLAADPALAATLGKPAFEMQLVAWMVGTWDVRAAVAGTDAAPESTSIGTSTAELALDGVWLKIADTYPDGGNDVGYLTYDLVARRWVALAIDGYENVVTTTGAAWEGNRLVLSGVATIVGESAMLRQTIEKESDDAYRVLNEDQLPDGSWRKLDEYRYTRRPV